MACAPELLEKLEDLLTRFKKDIRSEYFDEMTSLVLKAKSITRMRGKK